MISHRVQPVVITLLFVATAAFSTGCTAGGSSHQGTLNGTVTFVDMEGGFFGIVGEDGTRYLPINLSSDYQKNGLEVWFTVICCPVRQQSSSGAIRSRSSRWGRPTIMRSLPVMAPSGSSPSRVVFTGSRPDDGSHYYPINLDAVYRVDGTRIAFSADLSDDATIAMWGFPVHITAIQDLGPCTVCKG